MNRQTFIFKADQPAYPMPGPEDLQDLRRFTITTEAVDRDGDIIVASGMDLTNYRKNPVVLWAHDYRALPIGKCTGIRAVGSSIQAEVQFASHDFAQEVKTLVDEGILKGASVGFLPIDYEPLPSGTGYKHLRTQLMEWSICAVPSNPEALALARSKGLHVEAIERALTGDAVIRVLPEAVMRARQGDDAPDFSHPQFIRLPEEMGGGLIEAGKLEEMIKTLSTQATYAAVHQSGIFRDVEVLTPEDIRGLQVHKDSPFTTIKGEDYIALTSGQYIRVADLVKHVTRSIQEALMPLTGKLPD